MNRELYIQRTHISFSGEEAEWLSSVSDHPVEDGYIFSRAFRSHDEFRDFLRETAQKLSLDEEIVSSFLQRYDDAFFAGHCLVMMFSDERSGSNRLRMHEEVIDGTAVRMTIRRIRGLTMDMAYLFLFREIDGHDILTSEVRIEDDPDTPASFF